MKSSDPLVSIITPSYNQADYIEETITSVLDQDYPHIEHIVMDGNSSDNTVEILKKYPHLIWTSEKDKGQTDAINKGFMMAKGDIIAWLNSDDYYEKNIISKVVEEFKKDSSVRWVVGNIFLLKQGRASRVYSPKISIPRLRSNPHIVKQPCTFFLKSLIEEVGYLDETLDYVMDYDLWLKLTKVVEPKMTNEFYAYFRIHDEQKTNIKFIQDQGNELLMLNKVHNLGNYPILYVKTKLRIYFYKILSVLKSLK